MAGKNILQAITKNSSLAQKFIDFAQPTETGFTKEILLSDLILLDDGFRLGNGGSWCREDGPLKKFNIIRTKKGNKIYSIRLDGFNKNYKDRKIRPDIRTKIVKSPCAILHINSNIECDHKDGMYDDNRVSDVKTQEVSDFQPLSKAANGAKRTHCKNCIKSGKRFDAKLLGYSESYTEGSESTKSCSGCYWYDPHKFNSLISKDFKKEY